MAYVYVVNVGRINQKKTQNKNEENVEARVILVRHIRM